jgi:lipopolysaccharide transport system ATP-binding protein
VNYISAQNLTVDFPIYGISSRSLKKSVLQAITGGSIMRSTSDVVLVRALDDITFDFKEGDRVSLLGHNGSGKSTLLRAIAGIYEPTSGTISSRGLIVSLLDIFLGMDMESTGLENILMRGLLMGVPQKKMRTMIDDIADFSGIGDYIYLPMRTYSSGMALRLAFATSTSVDCDILLMDEWLSVGDQEFSKKANDRLNAQINKSGIVVLATHDHDLAKSFCNKSFTLEHGKFT